MSPLMMHGAVGALCLLSMLSMSCMLQLVSMLCMMCIMLSLRLLLLLLLVLLLLLLLHVMRIEMNQSWYRSCPFMQRIEACLLRLTQCIWMLNRGVEDRVAWQSKMVRLGCKVLGLGH